MNKSKLKKVLRTSKYVYGRTMLDKLLRPFWVLYYKLGGNNGK